MQPPSVVLVAVGRLQGVFKGQLSMLTNRGRRESFKWQRIWCKLSPDNYGPKNKCKMLERDGLNRCWPYTKSEVNLTSSKFLVCQLVRVRELKSVLFLLLCRLWLCQISLLPFPHNHCSFGLFWQVYCLISTTPVHPSLFLSVSLSRTRCDQGYSVRKGMPVTVESQYESRDEGRILEKKETRWWTIEKREFEISRGWRLCKKKPTCLYKALWVEW